MPCWLLSYSWSPHGVLFLTYWIHLVNSVMIVCQLIYKRGLRGGEMKNVILAYVLWCEKMYIIARGHSRFCFVQLFLKLLYWDLHLLLKSSKNEYWKSRTAAGGYSVSCISCFFAVLVSFTGLYQQPSSKSWQNLRKKFPPLLRWTQWHHMCFCRRDTLNDTLWHSISAFPADAVYHLNTGRVSCKALPRPLLSSSLLFSFSL